MAQENKAVWERVREIDTANVYEYLLVYFNVLLENTPNQRNSTGCKKLVCCMAVVVMIMVQISALSRIQYHPGSFLSIESDTAPEQLNTTGQGPSKAPPQIL